MKFFLINISNKKIFWVIVLTIIVAINIALFLSVRQVIWIILSFFLSTIIIILSSRNFKPPVSKNGDLSRITHQTQISLGVYSLICAFIIYALRRLLNIVTINPYTDWNISDIHPAWYLEGSVGVYNKFHIRQGFFQILILFFLFYIFFFYATRFVNYLYPNKIVLHPANSTFALISVIYAVRFPPYNFDLAHWGGWIGSAVSISNGNWPFLNTPNEYGVLPAAVLYVIFELFPMVQFWTYALTAITVTLAGFASYILISEISKSKWIGLSGATVLLFGFHFFPNAVLYPNSGAWRYQFMLSTTLLLCWYLFQRKYDKWSLLLGIILGLFLWWDPVFQAFMAIALTLAFLYIFIVEKEAGAIKKLISTIVGGLIPFVLFLITSEDKSLNIYEIIQNTMSTSKVFSEGYGGLPQNINWSNILWVAGSFLGFIRISEKLLNHAKLAKEEIFIFCGFVYSFPLIMYHFNRTSWIGDYAIAWIMLPMTILIIRLCVEKTEYHHFYYPIVSTMLFTLILSQEIIVEFSEQTNRLLFGYEGLRYQWAMNCSEKLRSNDDCQEEWPDPFVELKRSTRKPFINLDDPVNQALINYCKENVPIVSVVDVFIYYYGHCDTQFEVSGLGNAIDIPTIEGMINLMLSRDKVVVDSRNLSAEGGFLDYVSQTLVNNGFYISQSLGGGAVNVYQK